MQQFIPFEDDWDALEKLCPEALVPYRVGLVPVHEPDGAPGSGSRQAGHASSLRGMPFERTA